MFIIIVFLIRYSDWPSGLLFFVPALLLSILTPLFLPFLSVSISYFILAVPFRQCLCKYSCMSSKFPIAMENGTFFFAKHDRYGRRVTCRKLTITMIYYILFIVFHRTCPIIQQPSCARDGLYLKVSYIFSRIYIT